jgi:HAD superfamily hydrolase (TIGR01509 family)
MDYSRSSEEGQKEKAKMKAIIFDIDGTLINSVDAHAQAWQDAFLDFGHEFDVQDIRKQIGKGGDQLMPVFLSPSELDAKGEQIEKHRSRIFKDEYLPTIQGFPKVRELFLRINSDGIKIVLASSAKKDELKVYKDLVHVEDLVAIEISSDDVEESKPHPDIFEVALSRLGISAPDVMVVGDTPYDAEAAGKAGLKTIGVLCGGFPEEGLRRAGCIAIYRDPADLLARYADAPFTK